ncbi:divergent protein kinase domain 2A-like [Branchiostoma lanceolatum]|uniref:divergent protein kinase domain 2A-like n=1 Tax=Branchiostoma lanceolatum TaxID=7740 RepID=UPI003455E763
MFSRRMVRKCCLPLLVLVSAGLAVLYIYLVQAQGSAWVSLSQSGAGDKPEGGVVGRGREQMVEEQQKQREKPLPMEEAEEHPHLNQSRSAVTEKRPKGVPRSLLRNDRCPACFGDNFCEEFEDGMIELGSEVTSGKVTTYAGTWDKVKLTVTQCASEERLEQFEKFVCRNLSKNATSCDPGEVLLKQDLKELLQGRHLKKSLEVLHPNSSSLAATTCVSKPLLKMLQKTFDENGNKRLNRLEQAHLYAALHTCPHLALLKAFPRKKLPVPAFLGACGNLVAMETTGKPLPVYLKVKVSWQVRANLSLQLLQMLDDFQNKDPDWLLLAGDVSMENFAVSPDGQLILSDLAAMTIISKHDLDRNSTVKRASVCNEACFKKFVHNLLARPETSCRQAGRYSQLMYAHACQRILGCWQTDRSGQGRVTLSSSKDTACEHGRGLLHGPPRGAKRELENLLTDCVEETKPDGRTTALKQIKVLLAA